MHNKKNRFEIVELKKNFFQIKFAPPNSHVYLIKGDKKIVMVDTGLSDNFSNLKDSLSKIALNLADIHLIVLTHEHLDHIGAATYFSEDSLIAAHTQAANKLALDDEFAIMNKAFDMANEKIHIDIFLEDGVTIDLGAYRLRVLHTPGHCSGCICIYEEISGSLITGDTILAEGIITGVFPSGSISDYINSLRYLQSLKISTVYPGHGKISREPHEDITKAVKNALKLLDNSRVLFNTLNSKKSFDTIFKSARKFSLTK